MHENGLNAENYEINSLLIEFSMLNNFHPVLAYFGCERVSYHYTCIFYWHCCISPCKFSSVIPLGFILRHFCHHFLRRPPALTHTHTCIDMLAILMETKFMNTHSALYICSIVWHIQLNSNENMQKQMLHRRKEKNVAMRWKTNKCTTQKNEISNAREKKGEKYKIHSPIGMHRTMKCCTLPRLSIQFSEIFRRTVKAILNLYLQSYYKCIIQIKLLENMHAIHMHFVPQRNSNECDSGIEITRAPAVKRDANQRKIQWKAHKSILLTQ